MEEEQTSIVRISMRVVVTALVLVLAAGFLGGMIGSTWFRPTLPPLVNSEEPLVATVQEVTISPGKATAQVVSDHKKSILLLGSVRGGEVTPIAMGVVVTNDGVVVTPTVPGQPTADVIALDGEHAGVKVSLLGRDDVYGLTYYRLQNGVLTPLDLAQSDPAIGSEVVEIRRNIATLLPEAAKITVGGYALPQATHAPAWQRLVELATPTQSREELIGNALLTEEGALAALRLRETTVAVPVSIIRESLQRLTRQERELNPLTQWGVALAYGFRIAEANQQSEFTVSVTRVEEGSPAAAADLKPGDLITQIGDDAVNWETLVIPQFSVKEPSLTITRQRGSNAQEVTLRTAPKPS